MLGLQKSLFPVQMLVLTFMVSPRSGTPVYVNVRRKGMNLKAMGVGPESHLQGTCEIVHMAQIGFSTQWAEYRPPMAVTKEASRYHIFLSFHPALAQNLAF